MIIMIIMEVIIVTIIACAVFDKSKPGGRFLPNPSWSALLSTGGARTIGAASLEFVGQRGKTAGMCDFDGHMRQKGGPNQQWLSWFVYLSSHPPYVRL